MNCFINTYYAYTKFIPTDIYPVQYGEEQCNRNHSFGPCVRSNYLLHYVYSGKGIFQTENNTYHLHKGQMFLISPNQLTYYKADDSDPWLYRWIEFNGSMSQSILSLSVLMKAHRFIPMMRIIRSAMHSVILFRPEKCVLNCSCKNFGISFTALQTANKLIPSAMPKNIFKKQKHL